jgi:hypothetical protein
MGRLVHVPAEDVGWGLSPGREGLSGLPNDEKPARNGFGEAGGIIHHLLWLHPVKATLREPDVTASAVLHFNERGQLTHLTAERYMEDHGKYRLAPWSVQIQEYQEAVGMRIPTRVEVIWHLASGDFSWFRCKITEVEYNQSGKVTRF